MLVSDAGAAAATGIRPPFARATWVVVHRWAGLTIALFVAAAGATGALLPWQEDLTFAARPSLAYVTPPVAGATLLDGIVVADRVAAATGGEVSSASLALEPDRVAVVRVAARAGEPALTYDTVWADPYSGAVRLRFRDGVLADGPQTIMPFLYRLHYSLALGQWGEWALGVAALVWTFDCFVGFYLTLPVARSVRGSATAGARSWWARWRPAWLVRGQARGYRLTFDLHRAGGLWLWPLLFVFAWTGVAFNLPAVEQPVMAALGASPAVRPQDLATPLAHPPIGLGDARRIGRSLMAGEARRRGFRVLAEGYIFYLPASASYGYAVRTDRDRADTQPQTRLYLDARTGALAGFEPPLGATAADAAMGWMYLLHEAEVFGLPYRIAVSVVGVAIVALTVTGVFIWMRKRAARLLGAARRQRHGPPLVGLAVPAE